MAKVCTKAQCPSCGTDLSQERESTGLCPACLIQLALEDTSAEAEFLVEMDEASTLRFSSEGFSEGEIQGERYRIRSLLGRGGMGEVWRAYDLKLRLDVALKALRKELIADQHALETLRQEVRVAREVISPNVCRVFDLQEVDGQELISMEYVDGTTLHETLAERGPLELNEARELASQFLAGLEAIHAAGLIHRDIKPENLMITRTGRVVVMDFGIAKGLGEGKGGKVAGTPAYMSPEQANGQELDARSDLFSVGVVLAEMVEPGGIGSFEDRKRIWRSLRHKTPRVSDTPWSKVIAQAVSAEPSDRYASAPALARALEEVTLRAAGDESARPYPGLSTFQEEDAEFFYGRELEVEALWKKLRRPHLLAVIGPSGAGKSSFLRAGLLPTLTKGWQALIATPGNRPFANLARALAAQLPGSADTTDALLRFEEPDVATDLIRRWRQGHKHGLIILDQFEELFTQNPNDTQQGFGELLGRLPLEADVFVLLSMRDDFLLHCQLFEPLAPLFSELTPLGPPTGASLRRAIVQPALRCGYRFEDESIVDEMLSELEGQRGALPLLAFAVAQLWETRDRDSGLLTRKAYEQIGGVGGALAQHAEAMLDYIGAANIPIVRELFRNLVTAQGTRASRDREELLSVFSGSSVVGAGLRAGPREGTEALPYKKVSTPEDVLNALIDARLLTSYDVPAARDDGVLLQRTEIVHESLLANWPRLVRWRTQDAQGAQLRDELRAQAKLWDEHGRLEDYLWTGTAFKEYALWRESYPGGLTEAEEAFGAAMTRLAERKERRRQAAITGVIAGLLAVLAVVTWSRFEAVAEARRAEAAKLLALAQVQLETDPTEALAYATASLELSDSQEARVFATRTLWEGPQVLALSHASYPDHLEPEFSPDGQWLSSAGAAGATTVLVWHRDGSGPLVLDGHASSSSGWIQSGWTSDNGLVTGHWTEGRARLWSFPGGELVREIDFGGKAIWSVDGDQLVAFIVDTDQDTGHRLFRVRSWVLPDGEAAEWGTIDRTELGASFSIYNPNRQGVLFGKGTEVFYRALPLQEGARDRRLASHENPLEFAGFTASKEYFWTRDAVTQSLQRWSIIDPSELPLEVLSAPTGAEAGVGARVSPDGRWLMDDRYSRDGKALLWSISNLPGANPVELRRSGSWHATLDAFGPAGDWFVGSTHYMSELSFWPLRSPMPSVVEGYDTFPRRPVLLTPDGKWLATCWGQDRLRLWPVPGSDIREVRDLPIPPGARSRLTIDSAGERLLTVGYGGDLWIVPMDGSEPTQLEGFSAQTQTQQGAFSPSGRRVAAATFQSSEQRELRIWNLEAGESSVYALPGPVESTEQDFPVWTLIFLDESTLLTAGTGGILRWDLDKGIQENLVGTKPGQPGQLWLSGDRQRLVTVSYDPAGNCGPLLLHDLATAQVREFSTLTTCADRQFGGDRWLVFDNDLSVMAIGRPDGTLWVGKVGSHHLHLMAGHDGPITGLDISPDGLWIATSGQDKTLRLWSMPDLDKPPLHELPHEELVRKLHSLTNLRTVRDDESSTGWSVEVGPFPGWAEVPTWQ